MFTLSSSGIPLKKHSTSYCYSRYLLIHYLRFLFYYYKTSPLHTIKIPKILRKFIILIIKRFQHYASLLIGKQYPLIVIEYLYSRECYNEFIVDKLNSIKISIHSFENYCCFDLLRSLISLSHPIMC